MKRIVKLCTLSIMFFFVNCENDNNEDLDTNKKVISSLLLNGNEAKIMGQKVANILDDKYSLLSRSYNRVALSEVGTVNYDEVMKVTDSTGRSTYSFRVENSQTTSKRFFNLVLEEKPAGNILKLLKYEMSDQFVSQYEQTKNLLILVV